MKKVMIGILVLIPVIILLVVAIVSTIISITAHIAVDNIELVRKEGTGDYLMLELQDNVIDMNDYFDVVIEPKRANNYSIKWSIEELECLDESYKRNPGQMIVGKDEDGNDIYADMPAVMMVDESGRYCDWNSTGKLIINAYSQFSIKIQAETVSDSFTVYVSGFDVDSILITGDNEVRIGESVKLEAQLTPIDSIVKKLDWASSDPSIASVDSNGVVKGLREGSVEITVSAIKISSEGNNPITVTSEVFTVNVQKGVSVYGDVVYTHSDRLTLSELGITLAANPAFVNCSAETVGDVTYIKINGNGDASLMTESGKLILRKVGSDDIAIAGAEHFAYSGNEGFILAVGEIPLNLSAVWASETKSGKPEVLWSSSNTNVATVSENGVVTGISSGFVTVTADYIISGVKLASASISIQVQTKVASLILDVSDAKLAVGIAKETVFASERYENEAEMNWNIVPNYTVIGLRIPTPPENASAEELRAFYDLFEYRVEQGYENLARFVVDTHVRLVFDPSNIKEKTTLKITVSAKYPKYQSQTTYTTKTVSITVVPGLEVNTYEGLVQFDKITDEVRTANSEKLVANPDTPEEQLEKCRNFVLGSDITYPYAGPNTIDKTFTLGGSVYGNNHMISGGGVKPFASNSTNMFDIYGSNIIVSNIRIRANELEEGGEITDPSGAHGMTGQVLNFYGDEGREVRSENVRLEYSIVENGYGVVCLYGTTIDIDGCILRNTSGAAFYVPTKTINRDGRLIPWYVEVNMNNCVMSNMIGTGFSFSFEHFSVDNSENPYEGWEETIWPQWQAAGTYTKFNQTGFLDMYNWQLSSELNLLDTGSESINLLLARQFEIFFNKPESEPYTYVMDNKKYVHMGFIAHGYNRMDRLIYEKVYMDFNLEDKRFIKVNNPQSILPGFTPLKEAPPTLYCYSTDTKDIIPGSTYTVDDRLIEKLRGEA